MPEFELSDQICGGEDEDFGIALKAEPGSDSEFRLYRAVHHVSPTDWDELDDETGYSRIDLQSSADITGEDGDFFLKLDKVGAALDFEDPPCGVHYLVGAFSKTDSGELEDMTYLDYEVRCGLDAEDLDLALEPVWEGGDGPDEDAFQDAMDGTEKNPLGKVLRLHVVLFKLTSYHHRSLERAINQHN